MSDMTEKMKVAAQAEIALLKAEARRNKKAAALGVIALGGVILSVAAVNVAVFYHITEQEPARNAAMVVMGINLFVAAIPAILASKIEPSAEEKMLANIRDRATTSLTRPVENLFSSTSSVASLSPLVGIALKALSKK